MARRIENSLHSVLSKGDGVAAGTSDIVLLIGRILLAWIFVRSGYGKIFNVEAVANSFPLRGLPPFLAYIAVPFEFFGGIALIFGFATRYVVLGFVIFMLVATFSSHRYWEFADAAARRAQDSSFYKNMAMLGGFFFLFICGSGRLSVDGWLHRRSQR
jgi:putative oxidoreductase